MKARIHPYSVIRQENSRAKSRYVPNRYQGPITLLWAKERPVGSTDRRLGWRDLATGGLDVRAVPGDHLSMMTEPHVRVLAQELQACLNAAQKGGTAGTT